MMNWSWQEWAVLLLVTACVMRLLWGLRTFFRPSKEPKNPCASCATGCALKSQLEEKQRACGESAAKKTKK